MRHRAKKIIVRETAGIPRPNEMVRVAVPCARGDFGPFQPLSVSGPDRSALPCQVSVLKRWPDGSAKWLLVDFPASVAPDSYSEYQLAVCENLVAPPVTLQVRPGDDIWQVDTGKAIFSVDAKIFRPFNAVQVAAREVLQPAASICALGWQGRAQTATVDAITLEESGPLHAVVRIAGRFKEMSGAGPRFFCRLHFFSNSSAVKAEFTLHNPRAAVHSGGLWDLGDAGSLIFDSLDFYLCCSDTGEQTRCLPAMETPPLTVAGHKSFSLYQEASGGKNWRSPVHRNRDGMVPMQRLGYVAEIDGNEVSSGLRASPVVWHGKGEDGLAVAVPRFWQEFPGEIAVTEGRLRVSPFPARFPDRHELQGGEQKTHEIWMDFATERDTLVWALHPLAAHADAEQYRCSGIFQDLPGADDLVDRFTGISELLEKRETADEYGWRHFGEIYADHEAVYHEGSELFVSHYNNQYDFIAGLYRKFFATGDPGWGELAADLSRHVRDVDIYHTDQDREEYNSGLFWHTDHYVDAGTSSHRSFSRQHLQTKPHHLCGGGPGAEHCYTTGLMLHYFHTGDTEFREAVIALATWELLALTGPRTVCAAVKRGLEAFGKWRSSAGRGRLFPRFPFTRGTGNAITACLDAFEVGGGRRFLAMAEELIRGAIHPEDDIDARNLLDTEVAWSYTILLAALVNYLDKKKEIGEADACFAHARASLVAYANWMRHNEYPYLDKPEQLEYPNETWAAQDLRKSAVFFHAARFSTSAEHRAAFRERANHFFQSSLDELGKHQGSRFARPVVLMLQNGWVGSRLAESGAAEPPPPPPDTAAVFGARIPTISLSGVLSRTVRDVIGVLAHTSIPREMAWIRARLSN